MVVASHAGCRERSSAEPPLEVDCGVVCFTAVFIRVEVIAQGTCLPHVEHQTFRCVEIAVFIQTESGGNSLDHVGILEKVEIQRRGIDLVIAAEALISLRHGETYSPAGIVELKGEIGKVGDLGRYGGYSPGHDGIVCRIEVIRLIKDEDAFPFGVQCSCEHVVAALLQSQPVGVLEHGIKLRCNSEELPPAAVECGYVHHTLICILMVQFLVDS